MQEMSLEFMQQMSLALCKVMSLDVSKYLYWFMFIHLWKDKVPFFIGGECNARVEFAQHV